MSGTRSVSGTVVIGGDRAAFDQAVLHVYLGDVGRQDAAASRLAETRVPVGPHRAGTVTRLPFRLEAPAARAGSSLALRVHLALHGGTDVQVGDKVSTAHVPVPAAGAAAGLEITVQDVR